MFGRILVVASTAGVVLSSPALSRPQEQDAALNRINEANVVVDSSSIDLSAVGKITSGSYATESHPSSTTCAVAQPLVDGEVLGGCMGSSVGSTSRKKDWCGWNSDNSVLYFNELQYSTADCTGTILSNTTFTRSGLTNGCNGVGTKYQCGTGVTWANYGSPQHAETFNSKVCGGGAVTWDIISYASCNANSGCSSSPLDANALWSTMGFCDDGDDDICFHVDSKINYKGIEYTYQELKDGKESECTVPHSPHSRGVIISTSCGKAVRVTDTHLLATTKGFRLAYSLKAGDVMYGGYDNSDMCTIQSVEKEKTTQQYFGLNCVHSEVLASGLRASTFGDFHTLPSWYMTYVGSLVGMDTASHLGEFIAEWFYQ